MCCLGECSIGSIFKFQVRPDRDYRGLITILRNLKWNQIGKAQVCIHIIISLMLN
jgi:hypothetical protein